MKKYTPVFGPQELFDNEFEPNAIAVIFIDRTNKLHATSEAEIDRQLQRTGSYVVAMRRIIKTPVWTVADQQAGRLPEVGAEVIRVDHEDEGCNVIGEVIATWHCAENNESSQTCLRLKDGTLFLVECYSELRPIETPEERAQRLRSEWVKHALDLYMSSPKNDVASMGDVYDALLSGELKAPESTE